MDSLHVVRIGEDEGRTALLVDGVVQSISPDDGLASGGYWAAMLPDSPPRRGLILGLGGGTLARLLQTRWASAELSLIGVDDDAAVLETARAVGWLPLPGLEVVLEDAFSYVAQCAGRFDYIALDLYRGERFVRQEVSGPFLRRVRGLLEPSGHVAINLFKDTGRAKRLERIRAVFEVERLVEQGGNLVVHARGPRKRRNIRS